MEGMLRMICLPVAVSCMALVACGGAIQQEDESTQGSGPKTTLSTAVPTAGTPYGAWDLVYLEGMPGGKQSTQTSDHLALELRNDGRAIARRCTKPYFEVGQNTYRCSDESAYDCLYGSVVADGDGWRLNIAGLGSTSKASPGTIKTEEADTIVVNRVLPKYSAGTFVRVTDDPPTRACGGS